MSENKYTPEPWRAFNNGEGVVGVGTDHSDVCWTRIEEGGWLDSDRTIDTDYENARRIVACVNACAGIPTYQLTAENDNPTNLGEVIDAIRKQRDELLEQVECSNITEKNMEGRLNKLIVQNAATKDRLDEHRDGRLSALEKLAVAEKQRDELMAALEKCRKELSAWMRDHGDDLATQEAVADARAAIASVKEKK